MLLTALSSRSQNTTSNHGLFSYPVLSAIFCKIIATFLFYMQRRINSAVPPSWCSDCQRIIWRSTDYVYDFHLESTTFCGLLGMKQLTIQTYFLFYEINNQITLAWLPTCNIQMSRGSRKLVIDLLRMLQTSLQHQQGSLRHVSDFLRG